MGMQIYNGSGSLFARLGRWSIVAAIEVTVNCPTRRARWSRRWSPSEPCLGLIETGWIRRIAAGSKRHDKQDRKEVVAARQWIKRAGRSSMQHMRSWLTMFTARAGRHRWRQRYAQVCLLRTIASVTVCDESLLTVMVR